VRPWSWLPIERYRLTRSGRQYLARLPVLEGRAIPGRIVVAIATDGPVFLQGLDKDGRARHRGRRGPGIERSPKPYDEQQKPYQSSDAHDGGSSMWLTHMDAEPAHAILWSRKWKALTTFLHHTTRSRGFQETASGDSDRGRGLPLRSTVLYTRRRRDNSPPDDMVSASGPAGRRGAAQSGVSGNDASSGRGVPGKQCRGAADSRTISGQRR
jgi:hypothetical protein